MRREHTRRTTLAREMGADGSTSSCVVEHRPRVCPCRTWPHCHLKPFNSSLSWPVPQIRPGSALCRPGRPAAAAACSSEACALSKMRQQSGERGAGSTRACQECYATAKCTAWQAGGSGAPIATNSSLTLVAVLALVSMKKMPLSLAYDSASCDGAPKWLRPCQRRRRQSAA